MKPSLTKAALFAAAAFVALSGAVSADARERSSRTEIQTKRGTAVAERSVSRENGAASREITRTGPNGKSRSLESSRTKTGPGAWEGERTVTGPNGKSRTQTGEFSAVKTETGRTVTGAIQTQNNGAVDYSKSITRGADGRTVAATGTFEDGTSWSRTAAVDCDKGVGCQSSGAFTNRAGETKTWSQSRTKTEDGWDKSRDVTFADGTTRSVDVDATKTGQGQASFDRTVTGRDGQTRTQTGTVTRGQ
jgi:hypothetical protein